MFAVVAATGFVLRLLPMWAAAGETDSDEAVVGLMAKHLLDGHVDLFYWGQSYGGTPEVFLVAASRALFGSSLYTLRLPNLLLSILATVLMWLVAKRLLPQRRQALLATAAFWLSPVALITFGAREMLFYTPTVAVGLAMVWTALRYIDDPRAWWAAGSLWLLGGLGFWMSGNVLYFLAPIIVFVVLSLRRLPMTFAWTAVFFLVGSAPWWVWNLQHDFASVRFARLDTTSPPPLDSLDIYLRSGTRVLLGLYTADSEAGPWRVVTRLALVVVVGALIAAGLVAVVQAWRRQAAVPLDVIGLVIGPLVYAALPYRPAFVLPRYFFFVWPFIALLFGRLARARWSAWLSSAVLAALVVFGVHGYLVTAQPTRDLGPVEAALVKAGRRTFFGDYWTAFHVTFDTDERLVGGAFSTRRYPPYGALAREEPRSAYVFLADAPDLQLTLDAAKARGLSATTVPAGDYLVVLVDGRLLPEDVASRPLSGF